MRRPLMTTTWLFGCSLLLASALSYGTDLGVVTILDGNARVLRGVSWYRLAEGARVQDGDVIDAADHAQVQVELSTGPIVNFVGPAELFAAAAGSPEGKQPAPAEMYLTRGWLKLAVKSGGGALRVRSPAGALVTSDGVAVMHAEPEALESFVERGNVRLIEPARGAGEGAAHALKGGDFAIRASDRPFASAGAPPPPFVAAMPRQFRDPLPGRAQLYQVSHVQLVADRPITYAEAEPWLTGPYRRAFLKRLQPRLADPEFRAPVMAKAQAYPEWHGVLVPAENPPADKAEAAPKAAEKTEKTEKSEKSESTWWPFGSKK
jgi:hypothetical protein